MTLRRQLAPHVVGAITVTLMTLCIVFWFVVMSPFLLLRLVPVHSVQRWASGCCVNIATRWVGSNQRIYRALHGVQGNVTVHGQFQPNRSYLVVSNHSAWADILVLFDTLHGHAPFGRFFLKQELIWVPIVGVVCWAMDFPFMKRHSREKLARNPELAAQDLQTTRKTCEVYKSAPVTVINFLEGTRFSEAKRISKKSAYQNLLNPKFGGLQTTLEAMGEQFAGMVNVTMVYQPTHGNTTWSWLCGRQPHMQVVVEITDIPAAFLDKHQQDDAEFKQRFRSWVTQLWVTKDTLIQTLRNNMPKL